MTEVSRFFDDYARAVSAIDLDASGTLVGVEHNACTLVRVDHAWRIAVTTPLDVR